MPRASILRLVILAVFASQVALVRGDNATGVTGGGSGVENRQPTLVLRYMIALQGILPNDDPNSTPNQQMPPDRTTPFIGEIKAVSFNFVPNGWAFCEGQVLQINQNQALWSLLGATYGGNGVTTFALPDLRGRVPIGAGQGNGLPDYALGQVGTSNPLLTVANLPNHFHTLPGGGITGATGGNVPFDNRQPSLALHFLIAADGEIMIVPWSRQPTGWTRCDGRLLSSAAHTLLFNNIGTTYGSGAGTFALPDARGRILLGDDAGIWMRGATSGSNNVTLNVSDIPAHTHTAPGGSTGSTGGPGFSANNYQPSLVMRWMISLFGAFPFPGGGVSFPCVGELRLIAGNTASGLPKGGWLTLNGALLSISENDTLFNLIGTTYGGDGQDTFAIPNLIGQVAVSAFTGGVIGETLGFATLPITITQLAPHAHLLDLRITGIQHFADSSAMISLAGTAGSSCQVDKSDDLATWSNLGTVPLPSGTGTINDPNPTHTTKRYYRAHP